MPIEQFSERDIPVLTAHSKTIGWYESADWEDFMRTGEVFGHRLESGEIVSSAYLSRFGDRLGWIALGLVATEEGKPLYQKSGFVDIGSTCKLVSEIGFKFPDCAAPGGSIIREVALETDRAAILRLDLETVGFDRARLLDARMRRAVKTLVAVDAAGTLVGAISGALDSQRLILGPLISQDMELALSLIARLSRHWNGCMRIDIPYWQPDLVRALLVKGFRQERVCPIMTYERRPLPATPSHYFALVGQAFG